MKLHYHPVSTTSRPIVLLVNEAQLPVDLQIVDLMTGEHLKTPFSQLNPNQLVPVLEDGDFRLTESSAILKYLAERFESPLYPRDLKKRARVNEVMDWVNTQLNRELAYGLVYPQIFPHHKRPTDDVQTGTLGWSQERARNWLKILDQHILADRPYVAGNELTIADFQTSGYVSLGETIRIDYSQFPGVSRWYDRMKQLKTWSKSNEVLYGFAGSLKDRPFVAI
jgi:glutathione S-transferase